jgi:poly(hydroxyalkanoate) depolymerase family esterase
MQDALRTITFGFADTVAAAIRRGLSGLRGRRQAPFSFARPRGSDMAAPVSGPVATGGACLPTAQPAEPRIHTGVFTCPQGSRSYLAFVPRVRAPRPSPLLLMLHGCRQSASDFARGTQMQARAAAQGLVVVFPNQTSIGNPGACWNWHRAADQQRDRGEPAILAALALEMARRFHCDAHRVYVAGLSAGGAMAITLGKVYPDVFRAVGAHSGVPHACAHDVPSAYAVMRRGAKRSTRRAAEAMTLPLVPTIVFHGDHDRTVNVRNAFEVVNDARGASEEEVAATPDTTTSGIARTARVEAGHAFTRTRMADAAGRPQVESWIVHGGGHAWFGGSADGTCTDWRGPDASAEMLRFFGSLD